jgi:ketosteroid isomerase-like protein
VTPGEVARAYLAAFATGQPEAVAAWVTEDFRNEHTAALGAPSQGRTEYLARLGGFLTTFVDLRYEVEDVVVDGDNAVAAYQMAARYQGEVPFVVRGVMRFRVVGERIAHRVDYFDSAVFLRQVSPDAAAALAPFGI